MEFNEWIDVGYLIAAALFIFGLKKLGHPRTAPRGNQLGALGMLVAVLTTILDMELADDPANWTLIIAGLVIGSLIGYWMAVKVEMTGMPELVALFNGFGGLSSFFLAWSEFNNLSAVSLIMILSFMTGLIGCITFSGSVIAFFKLSEILKGDNNFLNKASRWFLIFSLLFVLIAIAQVIAGGLGYELIDLALIQKIFIALLIISLLAG